MHNIIHNIKSLLRGIIAIGMTLLAVAAAFSFVLYGAMLMMPYAPIIFNSVFAWPVWLILKMFVVVVITLFFAGLLAGLGQLIASFSIDGIKALDEKVLKPFLHKS